MSLAGRRGEAEGYEGQVDLKYGAPVLQGKAKRIGIFKPGKEKALKKPN